MGVTLNSFLDIFEEMVEGEGALEQAEINLILDKLLDMSSISLAFWEHESTSLANVLDDYIDTMQSNDLQNPVIIIRQNEDGFLASILADGEQSRTTTMDALAL